MLHMIIDLNMFFMQGTISSVITWKRFALCAVSKEYACIIVAH